MRTIVVTRFAMRFKGVLPGDEWIEKRFGLLRWTHRGLQLAATPGLIWVLQVAPEVSDDVRERLRALTIPSGTVAVMDTWAPEQAHSGLVELATNAYTTPEQAAPLIDQPALSFRLDSDDVLLPGAIARVQALAEGKPRGALFDMWAGYRLDTITGRLSLVAHPTHYQGPFYGRLSLTGADALDFGVLHPDARSLATEVHPVPGRSFLQVCHGGNVLNRDPGKPGLAAIPRQLIRSPGDAKHRLWRALDGVDAGSQGRRMLDLLTTKGPRPSEDSRGHLASGHYS
jgi:hypothetical protein